MLTVTNIRGANGAGKSTLVRAVMAAYPTRDPFMLEEHSKRLPSGYTMRGAGDGAPLCVLGRYEDGTPSGGLDITIKLPEDVYVQIRLARARGEHVLYEGIMVQHDVRRCCELHHNGADVMVVAIIEPRDVCVEAVRARRLAIGNTKPFDPANVIREWDGLDSYLRRLRAQGVPVVRKNRQEALAVVRQRLAL